MDEADEVIMETKFESTKKTFYIKQGETNYKFIILLYFNYISFKVSEMNKFMQSYEINLNLEQIKEKHITFSKLSSLQEFLDIIIEDINKKAIFIYKKTENKIKIEFKKYSVSFELNKENINMNKIVENINITIQKYDTKISNLETNFDKVSKENKLMKKEIDELKKNNEVLVEKNKKFQEEITRMKRFENFSKDLNTEINIKIEELVQIILGKEEEKKQEEFESKQKIQLMSKDIQNLKNDLENLRIKYDKIDSLSFRKNEKENSINSSNNYKNKIKKLNNIFFHDMENNNKNINPKKLRQISEINEDKSYDFLLELEKEEKFITPKHKKSNGGIIKCDNYNLDINPNSFRDSFDNNNIYINDQNHLINLKKNFFTENENMNDNKHEIKNKIFKKHIIPQQKLNFDSMNKNKKYQNEEEEELINKQRSNSSFNRDVFNAFNTFIYKNNNEKNNNKEFKGGCGLHQNNQ